MRKSADELTMAGCIPRKSSGTFIGNLTGGSQSGGGTGNELHAKLCCLVLLSLTHQQWLDAVLLSEMQVGSAGF